MIETVAIVALLVGFLAFREWRSMTTEREWARERAALLQRIQSPDQAVVDHSVAESKDLTLHVPFDDDEEAFLAREQMNGRN